MTWAQTIKGFKWGEDLHIKCHVTVDGEGVDVPDAKLQSTIVYFLFRDIYMYKACRLVTRLLMGIYNFHQGAHKE